MVKLGRHELRLEWKGIQRGLARIGCGDDEKRLPEMGII